MNGKQTKLSKWLYLLLLGEYDVGIHQHKWIHFIKQILISVGCPDLLNKEVIENPKSIKNQISKTLSDLYVQEWHNKVTSSSKGKNYTLFKQDISWYQAFALKNVLVPTISTYYHSRGPSTVFLIKVYRDSFDCT